MKNNLFLLLLCSFASLFPCFLFAQDNNNAGNNAGEIHGNMQVEAIYYKPDTTIGADTVPEKMLMNGFVNVNYTKGNFSAGIRYESYLNHLQGYPEYKGNGIPYRYASYKLDELEVTAGNFYEQFGSGMVLRAYEEKGLGIDNAFDGLRLKYTVNGFYLKGLIGKQRNYFSVGDGIVRAFDGEVHLSEAIKKWNDSPTQINLGGSFVSKYQQGKEEQHDGYTLKMPENVGASAGRIFISRGRMNFSGEYAAKINDPSGSNGYLYRKGESVLLNTNYSVKGFALSLGAIRTDNFSFKSDRNVPLSELDINFLPALVKQHTYALLAFYPYSTQPNGQMGFQADMIKKFKKETFLGGQYGTDVAINFSGDNALDTTQLKRFGAKDDSTARMGYRVNNYFATGQAVFRDVNIEVSHKFSHTFKMMLTYADQVYNKFVIQAHGEKAIYSSIWMTELAFKLPASRSLRMELQHLFTEQDQKSWAMGLLEYGAGNWLISVQDLYNYGNDNVHQRFHYYNAQIGYTKSGTAIQLSYGKRRAGIFCVGGVCRYVPASNGLSLLVTSSF